MLSLILLADMSLVLAGMILLLATSLCCFNASASVERDYNDVDVDDDEDKQMVIVKKPFFRIDVRDK
jgi:hypothetical protein